jgi:endonuclease III
MGTNLSRLLGSLRRQHGRVFPPPASDAFQVVVWEKVAYLASDARRAEAFELLRRRVGLTPGAILAAKRSELVEILETGGIGAPERVNNLVAAAELVVGEFDGSLDEVCSRPLPQAKKQLKRIRGIGDPGAEKILLLTRQHPVMGLDSNGLRVLTRLGYGLEAKTYSSTYKSVTAAALPELGNNLELLVEANVLLRHHGQTVCKTTRPRCGACSVRSKCPTGRKQP